MGHWSTYRRRGGRQAINVAPIAPGTVTVTSVVTGAGNTAVWTFSADIVQLPAFQLGLSIEGRGELSWIQGPGDNQITVTYDTDPLVNDDWLISNIISGLIFTGSTTLLYPQNGVVA